MSVSRTALRLIALLFLLAGVLLLRKPVFGQSVTAAPTPQHLPASENMSVLGQSFPIMDTCSSGGHRTPTLSTAEHNILVKRIWQGNCFRSISPSREEPNAVSFS
jgi:hypothetical protein